MAVEYFTFPGNGEVVQAVFNGVAMISGSTMMGGAMQAAALFGFLVALSVAVFKLDLRESFTYLFVVAFIWMGMIVPKTTVLITPPSIFLKVLRTFETLKNPFKY